MCKNHLATREKAQFGCKQARFAELLKTHFDNSTQPVQLPSKGKVYLHTVLQIYDVNIDYLGRYFPSFLAAMITVIRLLRSRA